MSAVKMPHVEASHRLLEPQADINGGLALRGIFVADPEPFGDLLAVCGVDRQDVPEWTITIDRTPAAIDKDSKQLTVDLANIVEHVNLKARKGRTTPFAAFTKHSGQSVVSQTARLFECDFVAPQNGYTKKEKQFIGVSAAAGAVLLTVASPELTAADIAFYTVYGGAIGSIAGLMPKHIRECFGIEKKPDPKQQRVAHKISKSLLPTFFETKAEHL